MANSKEKAKTKVAKTSPDLRENLLRAIEIVDRPGSFSTSGDLPFTMPGLEVEGIGAIGLPLGKTQARALIQHCSRAPYGKGVKTLVDTDVRRVWELDPEQFRLTNPKWDAWVVAITNTSRIALGLEDSKLKANLYKLLVYEEGGFFLPHRDGEKLERMVATLVIGLPSPHTGGELIVTHEGRRHEIMLTGAASGHEMSYAAFYADCEHEVLPIRAGYRLCLVYNLTLATSRRKTGIVAPQTAPVVASISELLGHWPSSGEITKLAITLEHQYTQDGLKIDTLKGVDRARAEVLFDAAAQAGYDAHLALITHWQSGSAEGDYGDTYGRGNYSSWSHDDEESNEPTDYEMEEVFDESLSINYWSDRHGNKIAFGEMDLEEAEIVSDTPSADWDLSRQEFEGYTGNEGMTLERWYHRAAIVLWPKKNSFDVLCAAGTDAAISGLKSIVSDWKSAKKSDQPQQRKSCLEFAAAIITSWGPPRASLNPYLVKTQPDRSAFPDLLQELDDPELVVRLMNEVMPKDGNIQLGESFPSFAKRHGWPMFESGLTAIIAEPSPATISRNTTMLATLCLDRDKNVDRLNVCEHLAEQVVTAIQQLDNQPSKSASNFAKIDRAGLLTSLIKALLSIEATESLDKLIDHTLSHPQLHDLTDVHLAAIFALEPCWDRKLGKANRVVSRWLGHCRTELVRLTAHAPLAPTDFRRAEKLSCRCVDCLELSQFLANPSESAHRFPLRKERRQHLHQIIDRNKCDLTHVTTRTGSPFTLVCAKTTTSYQEACKVHARYLEDLKRLRAVEAKIKPTKTARDNL